MKKCKICNDAKFMKKLIDKKYQIYDERHSYCFDCRPTLGEEGQILPTKVTMPYARTGASILRSNR
jgi:hypothetical protein